MSIQQNGSQYSSPLHGVGVVVGPFVVGSPVVVVGPLVVLVVGPLVVVDVGPLVVVVGSAVVVVVAIGTHSHLSLTCSLGPLLTHFGPGPIGHSAGVHSVASSSGHEQTLHVPGFLVCPHKQPS